MAACMPVATHTVEMKHLFGQEANASPGGRRRGRRLQPHNLHMVTYAKSVKQSARRMQSHVCDEIVGATAAAKRKFGQCLKVFEVGRGRRRTRAGKANAAFEAQSRRIHTVAARRKRRALDEFVNDQFHTVEGDYTVLQQRQRLNEAWKALPAARKRQYQQLADAENVRRKQQEQQPFQAFESERNQQLPQPGGKQSRARERQDSVRQSLLQVQHHKICRAGAQLACLGSGLKEELVISNAQAEVTAKVEELFKFDSSETPTKSGHTPFSVSACWHRCGLCVKADWYQQAKAANDNLAHLLKTKFSKQVLPILLPARLHNVEHDVWATQIFGSQEVVWLVSATLDAGNKSVLLDVDGAPEIQPAPVFFRNMFKVVSERAPGLQFRNGNGPCVKITHLLAAAPGAAVDHGPEWQVAILQRTVLGTVSLKFKKSQSQKSTHAAAAANEEPAKNFWGIPLQSNAREPTLPSAAAFSSDSEDEAALMEQRGRDEDEMSDPDAAADGNDDEHPPLPLALRPGIKGCGVAKNAASRPCPFCQRGFNIGDKFLSYRMGAGSTMANLWRVHPQCVAGRPDIFARHAKVLEDMLLSGGLDDDLAMVVSEVYESLTGAAAVAAGVASSSSVAGGAAP